MYSTPTELTLPLLEGRAVNPNVLDNEATFLAPLRCAQTPDTEGDVPGSSFPFTNLLVETMKLQPDFGPNDVHFPALPSIRDPSIEMQVFTHRSYHARPTHVFEDPANDLSPDNERYEHLGDAVLGLVVTSLMFELFPGLRVGPSTKVRSMIVGNATLAEISKKYRLPQRLRVHPSQEVTLKASTNVQADLFESFVGGLFCDQGLNTVQQWLSPLFRPFAFAAHGYIRSQHNLPPLPPTGQSTSSALSASPQHGSENTTGGPTKGHLALFNQVVQRENRQVEWVYSDGSEPVDDKPPSLSPSSSISSTTDSSDGSNLLATPLRSPGDNKENIGVMRWYSDPGVPANLRIKGTQVTPVWYVKVLVDGEFFGRGRGNTKRDARNEAAKEGLVRLGIEV